MPPTAFGPYSIVMSLGSGGMADVYLARDAKLDRLVAVKAPHRELVTAEIRARFRREAHAAAALEHPAIVPIYDYNESGELPYIVMRYLTGGSLEERIAQQPYPLAAALPILERVAAALDHAHSHGIIHRDVKSANILFDEAGNAYVSDFGIAWMARAGDAGTRLTDTGVVRGTFDYISPEQARGERELDGRSDLYSLAVVLFEMLTGKVPYQAESGVFVAAQHISAPIPDIRQWRPDLPPAVTAVMRRALAKQRDARYPTGAALLADLRRAAGGGRIATGATAAGTPRRLWVAGGLAVLAVALFILWQVIGGGGEPETPTGQAAAVFTPESEPTRPPPTSTAAAPVEDETPPDDEPSSADPAAADSPTLEPVSLDPDASPDDDRAAAFALPAVPDEIVFQSNRDGDYEIYIMPAAGGEARQLTDNGAADNYPRVSPDGQRILFVSERDGNPEVYVMNRDGSEQTRLTADAAREDLPAWSPDGEEIVFLSSRDGLMDVFMMAADGRDVRQITDSLEREGHVSWSVNDQLAYNGSMERYWQLWLSDADGANRRQLTNSTYDEWSPEWSPDGEWLLFLSERDSRTNPGIYVMRPDGSDARLVYNGSGEEWGAVWSADGTQIVFTAVQPDDSDNLYIMDAGGGAPRLLAERGSYPSWAAGSSGAGDSRALPGSFAAEPQPLTGDGLVQLTFGERNHYTPVFAPDQARLLLSVEMDDGWQIYEADPNGGGLLRQLTSGQYDHYQAAYSPDGLTFLTSANLDGDGDIYLFDATTGEQLQQVTDNPGLDYHPRWLPDGQSFIFSLSPGDTSTSEVFLGTLDGRQTQLTHNDTFDGFATPSADGQYITFYSGRDGDYEIYVMDANGGDARRLTVSRGRDASPSFSPDGQWIVFESERSGNYELYAVPFAGGEPTRLTDSPGGNWCPIVSPDGQWLLFQSDRGGYMDIYRQEWVVER